MLTAPGEISTGSLVAFGIVCLITVLIAVEIWRMSRKDDVSNDRSNRRLDVNADLRHFLDDAQHHRIPCRQRPAWFAGITIGLCLLALVSWTAGRDDDAQHSDRIARRALKDNRLPIALKNLRCPPPDAPLEKFLVTVGIQSDGQEPELRCAYITADLGVVPRIRLIKPHVVAAQ